MFRPSQPVASILTRNAVLSAFDFARTLDAQRALVDGSKESAGPWSGLTIQSGMSSSMR